MKETSKFSDKSSSNQGRGQDRIEHLCKEILRKLPYQLFNLEEIAACFPIKRTDSLNTVVQQETERYNGLVAKIKSDLKTILSI